VSVQDAADGNRPGRREPERLSAASQAARLAASYLARNKAHMGKSLKEAAPEALVRSSGCTASQIFFFCTLQQGFSAARRAKSPRTHLFSESGPVCAASPKRTRSPTFASAGGDSCGRAAVCLSAACAPRRRRHARTSSTFSCFSLHGTGGGSRQRARAQQRLWAKAHSEAARSMPNDLTPRMLRALRLHSTTTKRPCAAAAARRARGQRSSGSCGRHADLQLLLGNVADEARADLPRRVRVR